MAAVYAADGFRSRARKLFSSAASESHPLRMNTADLIARSSPEDDDDIDQCACSGRARLRLQFGKRMFDPRGRCAELLRAN
jgi:hypothetical protein